MAKAKKHKPASSAPKQEDSLDAIGFLALMRQIERRAGDKPLIGRSRRLRDDLVDLGQDPFLAFPTSNISHFDQSGKRPVVRTRFLGFFGPHGALPLNTTEEVLRWAESGDKAFVSFTDIFVSRFLQLYFRSWSDAQAITQFDHPTADLYQSALLSMTGIGTPAFRGLSTINDTTKLRMTPLAMGRVKSPVRLRQMLELHLGTSVTVEEMVPMWMDFEPDARSAIGQQGSTLGQDLSLGSRVCSVGEKICLHVQVANKAEYRNFLPGGSHNAQLADIAFWYLGKTVDIDVTLWLPSSEVEPAITGRAGELGWTASLAPKAGKADEYVQGARYQLEVGLEATDKKKAA